MKKKLLSCLLIGTMLLTVLGGCGNSAKESKESSQSQAKESSAVSQSASVQESSSVAESEEKDKVIYPIEGNVKLKIGVLESANITAFAKDIGETEFGKAWQEQTGVTLEVVQVANNNAMSLLLNSGDLPDIIIGYNINNLYPGGASAAVEDKIIAPITDYMEYAPDFQSVLDSDDYVRKVATTLDGEIWGFPQVLEDSILGLSTGLVIRGDWLEDLGLEAPRTAEELYNVLKAFKEKKDAEVPFSMTLRNLTSPGIAAGTLTSPFGLPRADYYQIDGKVHYGYMEPQYKDVLAYLKKLYDEGLLDPNFSAVDAATQNSNFLNGFSGVTIASVANVGTYVESKKDDSDFELMGLGALLTADGGRAMSTTCVARVDCFGAFITTGCKDMEAAVSFLNYGYSEAGSRFFNFGTEGKSYTVQNGVPTYTDTIQQPESMTKIQALAQWTGATQNGPYIKQKEYILQYNSDPVQQQTLEAWSDNDVQNYILPRLTLSVEDSAEWTKIMGDVWTYVDEMLIKYVTGVESLDTFETEYIPMLEKFGVPRAIEIYQNALDEFNAR